MNSITTPWRAMLFAWLLLACLFVGNSYAQEGRVDQYTVTNIGNAYTALVGGTATGTGDSYAATVSLPFNFNYDNQSYTAGTSIRFGTDGWLEFAGSQPAGSPFVDRVANTSYNYPRTIYVFNNDMYVV